ncbi:NAD(P)/FAD-dependent oxidoreductase [Sulfurimonas marina]|uniref:NAD(P)/FAD-dependent oxidoreductase n=1 Tax=Sulfurimonas marina TaxID=2590551 RepID=A0A7M1ASZ9_9BACT|nr:NAD(P)/FAD-dependent oxidoreductase [Sulfurimonas marina]QOP40539.1 NAD(P)/FAD-dependent oxidoreductase [Sulfurimonas marina]
MQKDQKNKIVIIGGGYAGLNALKKLAKDQNNEIVLIDKKAYHFMQTDVYDLIANEHDFAQVSVDLFTYCTGFDHNVTFLKEEIKSVDFKNKKVISERKRITYDYLIIAVGARTKFFSNIEGLREYAYGVKALHRAMYFKQKFEMSLFQKIDQEGTYCKPLNIVIAGGGLSGVEISAQMASFAKEFYKNNNFLCRKLNIVLVNSSEFVLKNLDDKLVKYSEKHLKKLDVTIKRNAKVQSLTPTRVTLSNGEELEMDFMIFAGGIEPNGLVFNLELSKNQQGYLETNEYLQSVNHEDVFVVGDCTTIYDKNKKRLPPTADIAEQMGRCAANNITRLIYKQKLKKHMVRQRGILIALGRRYACGKVFGLYLNGFSAYLMKKAIEKLYLFKLNKQSKKGCKKIFCTLQD